MSIKETTVLRKVIIDAPVQTIWKALQSDDLSSLHLLKAVDSTPLREGGLMEWYDREEENTQPRMKGRITVIAPPRRIAFMAFMPSSGLPDIPQNYTAVDITLHPEEESRTLVTVEHGDFAQHPHGIRLAKQAGDSWVEALIRLKERVEHEAAA